MKLTGEESDELEGDSAGITGESSIISGREARGGIGRGSASFEVEGVTMG